MIPTMTTTSIHTHALHLLKHAHTHAHTCTHTHTHTHVNTLSALADEPAVLATIIADTAGGCHMRCSRCVASCIHMWTAMYEW